MEFYKEKGNSIYTFDELFKKVKTYIYDKEQLDPIERAYFTAEEMHEGQTRKSGEPYILHPLNVAYITAEYRLDYETICAALLHDVVEDTEMTLEQISEIFGKRIAMLVDGVTKITNMSFNSKNEEEIANVNKILQSMCKDIRILFIKLADRLHNMRTMSSMPEEKQILKANETYEIYVPLAYRFGLYRVKDELDDISLYYSDRASYEKIFMMLDERKDEHINLLTKMKNDVSSGLLYHGINSNIDAVIKNIASVYRRLKVVDNLDNMHDLLSLKVIVPQLSDCYVSLGIIHSLYPYINKYIKDYIASPKLNHYRSLHTVVFGKPLTLVQARIRTPEMEEFAHSGIITYCQSNRKNNDDEIKNKLIREFSTFKELVDLFSSKTHMDARKLISDQSSNKISVYTSLGKRIELPYGSTILDVAFHLGGDFVDHFDGAFANNRPIDINYILKDGDILKIIKNDSIYAPKESWIRQVKTESAREKVKSIFQ